MSLKTSGKIFVMLAAFLLLFATLILVINQFLSQPVYLNNKKKELLKIANQVEQIVGDSTSFSPDQIEAMNELDDKHLSILIINSKSRIIYPLKLGLLGMRKWSGIPYMMSQGRVTARMGSDGAFFTIKRDQDLGFESLTLRKQLNSDLSLMMSGSLSQITDHMGVASYLLVWVTLFSLFVVALLAIYFTKKSTKRLIKINEAAKRLAALDFSQSIALGGSDEISDLASSIDWLSEQLKQAIALLDEQNSELQADLVKKDEQRERMNKFISMLSHELKSPLFIIQGYSELLLSELATESKAYSYTDNIMKESDKMCSLVSKMLHLAQLVSPLSCNKERYDLAFLTHQIIALYAALAQQKEITIDDNCDTRAWVTGEIMHGELILRNYLSNALAHANKGSHITIRLIKNSDGYYMLEVFNEGPFIGSEHQDKIWQPFYKGDKSRNRMLGGTGLGLSLVAAIQKENRGGYGYYNTKNGVLFWATFTSPTGG